MKKHLLLIVILALSLQIGFAEVVLLKDGSILKGVLTNATADSITLTTDTAGAIVIAKSSIKKIFQTEADYLTETSSVNTSKSVETAKTEEKKSEESEKYSDSDKDDEITVTDSEEFTQKQTKKAIKRANREKKREIRKEASEVFDSYFLPGYVLGITAPLSVMANELVICATNPGYISFFTPMYLGITIASAAIGAAPYGGPIALAVIYGVSAFVVGTAITPMCNYGSESWKFCAGVTVTLGFVAVLEIVATIIQFVASGAEDEYKENKRKEQRVSMFAAPGFSGKDFKDTDLVAGFSIRL